MRHHSDDADMACRVNWIAETLARDSLEKRFGEGRGEESERSVEIREGRKSVRENVELMTLYFLTPVMAVRRLARLFPPCTRSPFLPSFLLSSSFRKSQKLLRVTHLSLPLARTSLASSFSP